MSKERLENMSPIGFDYGNVLLKSEDYHWLMEQAERVEELEETIVNYQKINKQLHEKRSKYKKQMKRYKQALEEVRSLYPLRNVSYKLSEIRKIVIEALESDNDE